MGHSASQQAVDVQWFVGLNPIVSKALNLSCCRHLTPKTFSHLYVCVFAALMQSKVGYVRYCYTHFIDVYTVFFKIYILNLLYWLHAGVHYSI